MTEYKENQGTKGSCGQDDRWYTKSLKSSGKSKSSKSEESAKFVEKFPRCAILFTKTTLVSSKRKNRSSKQISVNVSTWKGVVALTLLAFYMTVQPYWQEASGKKSNNFVATFFTSIFSRCNV